MGLQELIRVKDIIKFMLAWAPLQLAQSWDNPGLQVGDPEKPVRKILIAMDVEEPVVAEAEATGVDMIISHHPLLFRPLRAIRGDDLTGRLLMRLIRSGIAVYSAHTNLDSAMGGVNDVLAARLFLQDIRPLQADDQDGFGRVGLLSETASLRELAQRVKQLLNVPFVLVAGEDRPCRKVAVCGGSGGSFVTDAIRAGADVFITGDVKYHDVQLAVSAGLAVIDAGHYATEYPVLEEMQRRISEHFGHHGLTAAVAAYAQRFKTYWQVL